MRFRIQLTFGRRLSAGVCFSVVVFSTLQLTAADTPIEGLSAAIDFHIQAAAEDVRFAKRSGDAEFLRRVFLDLAGRIPTTIEARKFLADASPARRANLIDDLLSGSDYPRRMQELFHVILMERRGENEEWTKFLRTAFEQNLPWHQMAAAILKPDADNESLRGAAYFHTARLTKEGAMAPVDVHGLTRDVGRLFAGIDLQCAQCHNHLTVKDYSQQDFQGLHMVFENVDIRRDVKFPAIGEKLMTEQKEFSSVFEQVALKTSPVVPGAGPVEIAVFDKGEEFEVPPDKKKRTPGVPKFSPLKELSSGLASPENELFCRNIVNRLWFHMMGRGLVEPLDLHHSENPATNPELLNLLAKEFAAHDFNIRWLVRELASTQTYQRSTVLPDAAQQPPETAYAVAFEKRLSSEQLFWSVGIATGEFEAVRRELEQTSDDKSAVNADDQKQASTDADLQSAEQLVAASKSLQALQKAMLNTFSNPPKEPETDFGPTVAGALFLMHSDEIQSLLKPRDGNLVGRLSKEHLPKRIAEELYLAILTRRPSAEESNAAEDYLATEKTDPISGRIANLVWAMLTSSEFMANH